MKITSLFLLAAAFHDGAYAADDAVKIVAQNWSSAQVMARIAEKIITEQLETPAEVVTVGSSDSFPQLAAGDMHLAFEMWNSGRTPEQLALIDSEDIDRVGELGVTGQVGWFVPSYVLDNNPELASWEAYQSEDTAALFATDSTAPNGRFLGVDPTWAQHDTEIISNLGFPFVVEYSGSEEASLEALANAVANQEYILMYWWTPTAAVTQYDLKQVALPPVTEECTASAAAGDGKYSCAYPEDPLFKLAWGGLEDAHPAIHAFAQEFEISTETQLELIPPVEVDGEDPAAVAADWVENNEATWKPWVDAAMQATGAGDAEDDGEGEAEVQGDTSSSTTRSFGFIVTATILASLVFFCV